MYNKFKIITEGIKFGSFVLVELPFEMYRDV